MKSRSDAKALMLVKQRDLNRFGGICVEYPRVGGVETADTVATRGPQELRQLAIL